VEEAQEKVDDSEVVVYEIGSAKLSKSLVIIDGLVAIVIFI
jgi:hypothetical protein